MRSSDQPQAERKTQPPNRHKTWEGFFSDSLYYPCFGTETIIKSDIHYYSCSLPASYDEKRLECISGAKIFSAFAMKFILHARILLPSPFSSVPKLQQGKSLNFARTIFTMNTSKAESEGEEGIDLYPTSGLVTRPT